MNGKSDQKKPHMPHGKTDGHKHASGNHPSHGKHNQAHGIPKDAFGHDGEGYNEGGSEDDFMGEGNC